MLKMMKAKQAGFTLMELLVVIVLLGIIITLGLTSYTSSQKKSRDMRRKSDLRNISIVLEAYYTDKGRYPNSSVGKIMGCGTNDTQECVWEAVFTDQYSTMYMQKLPGDPVTTRTYYYIVGAQNKSFQIYTRLENTLDVDLTKDENNLVKTYADLNCAKTGTAYCNYGVTSQNTVPDTGRTIIYQ